MPPSEKPPPPDKLSPFDEPVSRVMTTGDLVTVTPEDDLAKVVAIFRLGEINHLPVLNKQSQLVGVVSSTDLLKLDAPPRVGWAGGRVREVMTRSIETIRPTQKLRQVAELFVSGGFHSLLVTASDGELLGIVTSSDVIRVLVSCFEHARRR